METLKRNQTEIDQPRTVRVIQKKSILSDFYKCSTQLMPLQTYCQIDKFIYHSSCCQKEHILDQAKSLYLTKGILNFNSKN